MEEGTNKVYMQQGMAALERDYYQGFGEYFDGKQALLLHKKGVESPNWPVSGTIYKI